MNLPNRNAIDAAKRLVAKDKRQRWVTGASIHDTEPRFAANACTVFWAPVQQCVFCSWPVAAGISDEFVSAVEDKLGAGHGAWDMLNPKDIIAAVLSLMNERAI